MGELNLSITDFYNDEYINVSTGMNFTDIVNFKMLI